MRLGYLIFIALVGHNLLITEYIQSVWSRFDEQFDGRFASCTLV